MRYEKLSAAIETDSTDAVEAIEDHTAMAACEASKPMVLEFFVEFAFLCIGFERLL
jgi:hypothetical protein